MNHDQPAAERPARPHGCDTRPNGPESHARPALIPLALRLRAVRDARGQSLEQFAVAIGISSKTLHRYEHAQRDPDTAVVNAVCAAAGCEPTWLLTGEGRGPEKVSG